MGAEKNFFSIIGSKFNSCHAANSGQFCSGSGEFSIWTGSVADIEGFQLYDENNKGESIITAKNSDGKVVGYAQFTDENIYFLESEQKGAGKALVEHLQSKNNYLVAKNVEPTAKGFWEKMGFQFKNKTGFFKGEDWDWEKE